SGPPAPPPSAPRLKDGQRSLANVRGGGDAGVEHCCCCWRLSCVRVVLVSGVCCFLDIFFEWIYACNRSRVLSGFSGQHACCSSPSPKCMLLPTLFTSFAGAASFGVSKPSGPASRSFAPGWKVDDLAPFRRIAGEAVITHFGGKKQTTLLPTVGGVCNHADRHVVAEEGEENEENEEEEDVDDELVELDFFVTDEKILVREMRCLACPGQPKGSLKVSDSEKEALEARNPPINVVSFMWIQRAKENSRLVKRPA
ncbi:unnamed protein product, partial [Ectocarpus fasciculatus]